MLNQTKFLLVTCCLEQTRGDILKQVVENLTENSHVYENNLTVFDNASALPWVVPYLQEHFGNIHVCDQNVGYWSAIQWWLNNVEQSKYTYIIESDMIHYAMNKLVDAERVLDENDNIGSVRCQQYSVKDMHLYNKDAPVVGSKKNVWQSHTNKVTQQPIVHSPLYQGDNVAIYENNFLTQLPALNRADALKACINELAERKQFTEFDFQKLYHDHYQRTAIIDGGIYHHDPGCVSSGAVTGSWTDPNELARIGYKGTRFASITPLSSYSVRIQQPSQ